MDDDRYRFAVGDTVRVANIVGPRMTVSKIITGADKAVLVETFWFNRKFEFQGQKWPPRFLAKASAWEDRPRADHGLVIPGDFEEHVDG